MKYIAILTILILIVACQQAEVPDDRMNEQNMEDMPCHEMPDGTMMGDCDHRETTSTVGVEFVDVPAGPFHSGVSYKFSWRAYGGDMVTHTNVHSSFNSDMSRSKDSPPQENGEGIYEGSLILDSKTEKTVYLSAHANINGEEYHSEVITRTVLPEKPSAEEAGVQEFEMTARNWDFFPSILSVKKGIPVKLTVESIDVNHGIAIPEFGIDEKLVPGEKVVIEFTPETVGEYPFFCSVFCGQGHKGMTGTLIVEE